MRVAIASEQGVQMYQLPSTAYWITAFKKKINDFSRLFEHTWPKSQPLIRLRECWVIFVSCARINMPDLFFRDAGP
jgi:hypothetical protein